jgi:hypothetical protein
VKTSPRNVTPFALDGCPLDTLDQTTLMELRKLADQTGWTVADIMHDLMEEFVARRKAEKEREAKIIRFPKRYSARIAASSSRNAVSFSSACTMKRPESSRSAAATQNCRPS